MRLKLKFQRPYPPPVIVVMARVQNQQMISKPVRLVAAKVELSDKPESVHLFNKWFQIVQIAMGRVKRSETLVLIAAVQVQKSANKS